MGRTAAKGAFGSQGYSMTRTVVPSFHGPCTLVTGCHERESIAAFTVQVIRSTARSRRSTSSSRAVSWSERGGVADFHRSLPWIAIARHTICEIQSKRFVVYVFWRLLPSMSLNGPCPNWARACAARSRCAGAVLSGPLTSAVSFFVR